MCGHVLLSSMSVLSLSHGCCAVCCVLSQVYFHVIRVYPVESQSLKILMSKCLRFFGMYYLKITLPLKETINSSTARFSEGLQNLENVLVSISNRSRIFRSLSYQVHSCCHQNVSNEGCEVIGPGDYQCQQSVQIFCWPAVTTASCFIDSFYANTHTDYQMLNWK